MATSIDILVLLAVIVGVAYFRLSSLIWTGIVAAALLAVTFLGQSNIVALLFFWIFFLIAAGFTHLSQFRQTYFTRPLIHKLRKQMPSISDTERAAIEAGNVWWEKNLFCGNPQWKKLLEMPKPTLTSPELDFLDNQVETLCNMLNDWDIVNVERNLPEEVWSYLKKEKFFGIVIPKEYGGLGFSALAHSTIVVKIATRSVSAAVNTMVPNSLGPAELLLHYGTDEQKNYYLPRLARGDEIPCFGLTSPEAGSDAGSITDAGVVCRGEYEGKEVLGIRLSWDKRYITLAPIASLLGIAFRLYDPDHLLGNEEDIGITLCLVPASLSGVEIGNRHLPLYLAFMNGPVRGKEVFIPLDAIIGGTKMAGQGWKMLMECLSVGRSISLPALSTACGKTAFLSTGAYARLRRQFSTPIANFEGIEEALGNIAGFTYLIEACRVFTAGAVDQHIKPSIASAIAKYHMTEMARRIVEHAMDVNAGHGIQTGPRNFLANIYMAMPISITVEGANILTRNLIIFGQGAIRCHPYILEEIELLSATETPETNKKIDALLLSHMGYVISNFVRSFWRGLTNSKLILSPVRGATARYYRQLSRMSSALALLSDVAMMMLGGALKRKERISARLGDILSQLYLASAVLKYYEDHGKPATDLNFVKWSIETCLYHTQLACDELLNNFPNKIVGKILTWIVFPLGRSYKKPNDMLYHRIVATMLQPSELRDRITRFCFVSPHEHDPIKRLEIALENMIEIEPLFKKFQAALREKHIPKYLNMEEQLQLIFKAGVLTEEEVNALRDFNLIQKEVIKVNEFSFDLSTVVT